MASPKSRRPPGSEGPASGKTVREIRDKKDRLGSFVTGLSFSPRGDLLVLGCRDEVIGWSVASGEERFSWKDGEQVRALSPFFEGGKKIASINTSGSIKIWDVQTGKVAQTLSDGGSSSSHGLCATPDGKTLLSKRGGPVRVWDLPAGTVRREINDNVGAYLKMPTLPDNRTAAWLVWDSFFTDLTTGAHTREVKAGHGRTWALALGGGSLLLTSGTDGLIKGWAV